MILRILKKDLKRKKTMNCILLMFIILATMFVASGLNNALTVVNGTDYYLDKAEIGDYCIITMGDSKTSGMAKVLQQEETVTDYRIEPAIYSSDSNIMLENGKALKSKNAAIFQSISQKVIRIFDVDNQEVTEVAEGHVYISGNFLANNDLHVGDKIRIDHCGTKLLLTIDGKVKDALLGSDFMGNTRYFMNDADIDKLLANEEIALYYQGEIGYVETNDMNKMGSIISDIQNVNFSGPRSTIKMCYVMDLIVAFVILILSVCLMLVSFVVLRFSINFTIMEEFHEIGVMKAIGIKNRKIRDLYSLKYLLLAVLGAIIGLTASIPFGNILIKSVSDNMILGNSFGYLLNIVGAVLVVVIIVLFAYLCTGRVKKLSPIDSIHSGQTGERYKKKSFYRIGRSHVKPVFYLAINDVLSSPKRFLSIIISFFLCTLFVMILVNTTETMRSDKLINTFGAKADLYITDLTQVMSDMGKPDRKAIEDTLNEKARGLTELGMPAKFSVEVWYNYNVSFEGRDYTLTCQQGVNCDAKDYSYSEGVVPQNATEIAITPVIAEMTGAGIGDIVTIDYGTQKLDCMITAYFESMNQLGQVIRLHEDAPTSMKYCCNLMQYKITFTDHPSKADIASREERIKKLYDNEDIMNQTEYCVDSVAVVDTLEAVQYMLLGITLVVVLLVTVLMERAFVADETSQIAILKAIGFKNRDIIGWHTFRFGIVALAAVLLAAVISIPATKLCISPVFGMMGTKNISFNIVIWKVFGLYPAIVVAMTLLIAWITAQCTRRISSSDTANIE